ncbi:MAG: hypothetical protein QG630_263 [Patescibacteria group bacterium]|nr:hypothetical protein [Patescibacteria group bacterium]
MKKINISKIILVLIPVLFIFSGVSKAETFIIDTCDPGIGNTGGGCGNLTIVTQVYPSYNILLGGYASSSMSTWYSAYNSGSNSYGPSNSVANKPVTYYISNSMSAVPGPWMTNYYTVNNTSNPLFLYPDENSSIPGRNPRINIPNNQSYLGNFNYITQFDNYNSMSLIMSITVESPQTPQMFSK